MATQIQFLGMAAYRITNNDGQVILIDPFLSDNPVTPVQVKDLDRVDLICVTHLAFDHLGDTEEIARKFKCPVCCGADVKFWLTKQGIPARDVYAIAWGIQAIIAGLRVRGTISMHTSARVTPDGQFISGPPLGFIIYPDPGVRIYHTGDSAISAEIKVIGEVYRPNIALLGLTLPPEKFLNDRGYFGLHMNEMTADEAALAARWLGVEYAIASHYFSAADNPDVEKFVTLLRNGHSDDVSAVKPVVLEAGDVFVYPPT